MGPELAQRFLKETGARLFNVYGPTEATVACLRFEVTEDFLKHAEFGVVPLGNGWNGQETVVVDDKLQPVAPGIRGELLLGGTQLATRYLSDKKTDHEKFFARRYPGRLSERWYRSGDLVRASVANGMMFHGVPPGVALPAEQADIPLIVKSSQLRNFE